ncbi:ABC transporter ATP-binding protein [Candidatus Dojkabacteria bacterium]|nr:ABC transporter ATP-binding protein [Candidatus Dojkabacteria bacterium]
MSQKRIIVENLAKNYKNGRANLVALDNVSFSLNEGEDMAIIGPSGSGKTTLLNLIGGLDRPTKGKVIINNQDITRLKDKELSKFRNQTIGFVFQFFNLQEYLKAYENVMIPMLFAGIKPSKAKEKAEKLIESVGLADRENYYPRQLSGGEMQRIAIARSLANDPKILLADEPTANLDKESAQNVLEIFDRITKDSGVSVIVITHDPNICKKFKNIIHIRDGKISKK